MPKRDAATLLSTPLERFRPIIEAELRSIIAYSEKSAELYPFYGQMAYHIGLVDEQFQPVSPNMGKLLRPILMLWSVNLASAANGTDDAGQELLYQRALPIAISIELIHNFSLIHDDIEDHDELRRHRPTLWAIWGEAHGINTGDGMYSLAHVNLWEAVARGLDAAIAVRIARTIDLTTLILCEGQYLDMSFEAREQVTPEMYIGMISRKTAALMRCACEVGGMVGAPKNDATVSALAEFGQELGLAFQLRDDILGIWEASSLGKTDAGDLRRKKMSLPVIHAIAHADERDAANLRAIYAESGPASEEQIASILQIMENTGSRPWCRQSLASRCDIARAALDRAAGDSGHAINTAPAVAALGALLDYIAQAANE
jgi:geranylgeranyl diphosphate synthase, type I